MSSDAPAPLLETYFEKRPLLLRYFTARTRNAETAEDIVQDIFVKIAALPVNACVGNPTAYLFTVGANIWRNQVRTHSRAIQRDYDWQSTTTKSLGREVVVSEPSPESLLETRQNLEQVASALAELPVKTREIFVLYRIEGMTQKAIAARLSISKSSVEKHLVVALKRLMARIAPMGP